PWAVCPSQFWLSPGHAHRGPRAHAACRGRALTAAMKSPLQVVFLVLVAAALAQALWQHDRLPEKVAAHFNGAGRPDGWLSRGLHTAWHIGTILFLAALFQGMALLPARLPKEYINLPHRDHWLAPERAATTLAWITGTVLLMG